MLLQPNGAFLAAIGGVLAIYCEFIWPGRVLPGSLGSLVLAWGGYSLHHYAPGERGTLLLIVSALLFLSEILFETHYLAGIGGTLALASGTCLLFDGRTQIHPVQIQPALACSLSVLLGAVTVFLASCARRARRNKWADIAKEVIDTHEGTSDIENTYH